MPFKPTGPTLNQIYINYYYLLIYIITDWWELSVKVMTITKVTFSVLNTSHLFLKFMVPIHP